MSGPTNPAPIFATPRNREERLELANRLYREFQNRCFWHSPPELIVTAEMIPFVVKGLRTHGGHRGFMLAAQLLPTPDSNREILKCR